MSQQSIRNELRQIREGLALYDVQHIKVDLENNSFEIIRAYDHKSLIYKPYPTINRAHNSRKDVRLIMGPYNSGKSTGAVADIILQSIRMPKDSRGIRRSFFPIVRNTYAELKSTTLKTWLEWTEDLGIYARRLDPYMEYKHQFNDGNGLIELEVMFLALDRPQDIRKLKSLQATGIWLNEAEEIHEMIFDHAQLRVGRYPPIDEVGDYYAGVLCDTNPGDKEGYIYRNFEENKPDEFEIFHQPGGLIETEEGYVGNPDAENIDHIKEGHHYYLKRIKTHSKEFIKVFCMGQYGVTMRGKVVYPEYNDDLHAVDYIDYEKNYPIVLAWDFGLTPCCLILQRIGGQIRAIKEFVSKDMAIRDLAESIVKPYLNTTLQGYAIERSIGDPAGAARAQTDAKSCLQILQEVGIWSEPAITNNLIPRLDAVKTLLSRLSEGQPAFILSKGGCPQLRKGFTEKYCYKRIQVIGEEKFRDEPDKNHPFSDIHDALQYAGMYYQGITDNNQVHIVDKRQRARSVWI